MINRKERLEEIHKKGFNMVANTLPDDYILNQHVPTDFNKIKVGAQTLDDAVINLGTYAKIDKRYGDKKEVLRAIYDNDYEAMRAISDFFFRVSGIYSRLCRYLAYLYRFDWYITPYCNSDSVKPEKIEEGFHKSLMILDNFNVKKNLGEISLEVIKHGCYYGYIIQNNNKIVLQQLPANYCRSRFDVNDEPAVEFNMKFFDDYFRDAQQKMKVLNLFPKEFKKAYILYKEGKLPVDFAGDKAGWYLLDPQFTVKFNINNDDAPMLISVIPSIIDLDAAQELDRKKMMQKLLKIVIQKMPIDKNGDLVFDVDESRELHNNAVQMLSKAIGIDVLTTFADVSVEDMSDSSTTTTTDELEKVERTVYNEAGISQMQFNTDGNIALEKSIMNDEASLYNLILQYEDFLNNKLLKALNKNPKKLFFKAQILTTTIYNYKEMAKLYKEQTAMGYSKILPQLALGQSQSSILANAYFENDVLDLVNVFIPPLNSNVINGDILNRKSGGSDASGSNSQGGRPEKEDGQKSEKTIQNKESMN